MTLYPAAVTAADGADQATSCWRRYTQASEPSPIGSMRQGCSAEVTLPVVNSLNAGSGQGLL